MYLHGTLRRFGIQLKFDISCLTGLEMRFFGLRLWNWAGIVGWGRGIVVFCVILRGSIVFGWKSGG